MFHKKFKIKTSTTMKASERKKFRSLIEIQYPSLSAEDVNLLLPAKSETSQTKILLHSGEIAKVYSCGNNPLFFEINDRLFPTVYVLWKFPSLLPTITTSPLVLEKINNGADLMAPGVIFNNVSLNEFNGLKVNDICAVRLYGNKAPVAVGTSTVSESDLLEENRKGKAVLIAHSYRDHLWQLGEQTHLPVIDSNCDSCEDDNKSTETAAEETNENIVTDIDLNISKLNVVEIEKSEDENEEQQGVQETEIDNDEVTEDINRYSMDDVLMQCFMLALRVNGKKIQLPILTSTFYRTYILNNCPPIFNLDIKKTSYKKLSVFLKAMAAEKLIQVKELSKGVESITEINTEHEKLRTFEIYPVFRDHLKQQKAEKMDEKLENSTQDNYKFPEIVEMFIVSNQVKSVFEAVKVRKGEALTSSNVRELVRQYVKENSLQNENNPREIVLDPNLANILLKKGENRTCMSWEALNEMIMAKMQHAYQITFNGEQPVLKKGEIEPINVIIAKRTGNKKVTLIYNLENFGIDPEKLANRAQVAVAASTSITPAPGGKGTQVLIQGNQLRYLQTLFIETYKIPRKYLKGFENVTAKKK